MDVLDFIDRLITYELYLIQKKSLLKSNSNEADTELLGTAPFEHSVSVEEKQILTKVDSNEKEEEKEWKENEKALMAVVINVLYYANNKTSGA
jgi:hypothetical protein